MSVLKKCLVLLALVSVTVRDAMTYKGPDVQAIREILMGVNWMTLAGWLDINSKTIEENCKTSIEVAECHRTKLVETYCDQQPSGDPREVATAIADVLEFKMGKKDQANRIRALTFSNNNASEGSATGSKDHVILPDQGNTASEGSPKGGIEARIPEGSVLRPEEGQIIYLVLSSVMILLITLMAMCTWYRGLLPNIYSRQAPLPMELQDEDNSRDDDEQLTEMEVNELEKMFDTIALLAMRDMRTNNVDVTTLRYTLIHLPCNLKEEHHFFVKKIKAELKKSQTIDEIFCIAGEHWDFLNYSLLDRIISRHCSSAVRKAMDKYVKQICNFRKKTLLKDFSKVYKRRPKKYDDELRALVTMHKIDWDKATLEDAETFRNDITSELCLFDFALFIVQVRCGSVEITWLVPESVVTCIQNAIMPSSPSMRKHHVTKVTIDGFISYLNVTAMQNVQKVVRLEWQAIVVHYGFILDELQHELRTDLVLAHLAKRRLLSLMEAKDINKDNHSQLQKVYAMLRALESNNVVGRLPTFCAALTSAGQTDLAERIMQKFEHLLKGSTPTDTFTEDDYMIPGELSTQLSSDSFESEVSAQMEGTTLTKMQHSSIDMLISSLLGLPTGALTYIGHTLQPLTLHWHCSASEEVQFNPKYSIGLLSEMAQEGIKRIYVGMELYSIIPSRNEMKLFESVHDGDIEGVIHNILNMQVPVDITTADGNTPLMCASQGGHVEIVEVLLQHHADVNIQNSTNYGHSALTLACQRDDLDTLSILLHHGANPNVCTTDGQTPLLLAVRKQNTDMVQQILKAANNVDVDYITEGGLSALMLCCNEGNSEIAELLLKSHANPNLQQPDTGFTPLMFACKEGHLDTVKLLLDHNAGTELRNKNGNTAAEVASTNGRNEVLTILGKQLPLTADSTDDLEHPDFPLMDEAVEELVKHFKGQMDLVGTIALYDADKSVALQVPRKRVLYKMLFTS